MLRNSSRMISSTEATRVAVLGASGYAGLELLRLLEGHPRLQLYWAGAHSEAGQSARNLDPQLADFPLNPLAECPFDEVQAVFVALPHGHSQSWVHKAYQAGCTVVDLSADYRLSQVDTYEKVYEVKHAHPELLHEAVYGLTEIHRDKIRNNRLIANPGCYPTSVILGTYPVRNLIQGPVVADCKSGVSGAGRSLKRNTHFIDVNESFSAYKIGDQHRHRAEMMEQLQIDQLLFTPHLLPVTRGILSTIYLPWKGDFDPFAVYGEAYADERFVQVLPRGESATLAHVTNTNRCVISLHPTDSHLIVIAAIDNLLKGASGAAVQNLNLALGFPEEMGLR